MATIKEAYCSFEVAKLLKEKPAPSQYILITDGNGFMYDNRVDKMSPTNMWAYLSDLLPEIKHPEIPECHASSSVKELFNDRF